MAGYFHGTDAALPVGALLRPGVELAGRNHGRSNHVYMTTDAAVGYVEALAEAYIWACTACTFATEATNLRAHVYQVEPLGPVEPDGAFDVPEQCVRTNYARILGEVPRAELQQLRAYGQRYL